jgi:hypothetical protein
VATLLAKKIPLPCQRTGIFCRRRAGWLRSSSALSAGYTDSLRNRLGCLRIITDDDLGEEWSRNIQIPWH